MIDRKGTAQAGPAVGPGAPGRRPDGRRPDQAQGRGRVHATSRRSTTAADGTWTHRLTLQTGASYRYRWTPTPTLTEPLPRPRFSGIVDLSKTEKTEMRAGSALVMSASDDPAAFYTAGYSLADREEGMRMGRWRALGARTKAAHARDAVRRARASRPHAWSRSAAATASLLVELGAAWPDATFDGFELSPPAIEIARGRGIPRAGRLEAYDGARVPAEDGAYDLAVLSHVLEHVPDPAPLLREAARVARAGAGRGAAGGQPLRRPAGQAGRGRADRPPARVQPRDVRALDRRRRA